jgi:serine O-acetyltransferase
MSFMHDITSKTSTTTLLAGSAEDYPGTNQSSSVQPQAMTYLMRRTFSRSTATARCGNGSLLKLSTLLQADDKAFDFQGNALFSDSKNMSRLLHNEPILESMVSHISLSENIYEAMASVIANELSGGREVEPLYNLLKRTCYESKSVRQGIVSDLTKALEDDPAVTSPLQPLLLFKGVHAITTARIANSLWCQGDVVSRHMALSLQSLSSRAYGVDIHPGATFGNAVFLDHATGLVIGGTSVLGNNIMLLHGITLGGSGKYTVDKRHPTICDNVIIGATATLLGNVRSCLS